MTRDIAQKATLAPVSGSSDLLDRIYSTGKVEAADGSLVDAFPAGVPRFHADEIARLVGSMRLTRTLETGMAYGLSTLAICSAHEARGEGAHIAVDPFQSAGWGSIGMLNLRRAGLADRVRLMEARSDEALPALVAEGVRLDFALIDGMHLFDSTLVDFFFADRMLDVGGVVVFHDTWMPAVAQAVAFVRANRAYEALEAGDSAMVALRKLADDDRAWDFHRDFAPARRRWRAMPGSRRLTTLVPPRGHNWSGIARRAPQTALASAAVATPRRIAARVAAELRPRLGTRRRRIETHRLRTERQRARLAADSAAAERTLLDAVDPRISPHDAMYTGDGRHYFSVGLDAIRAIDTAAPAAAPARILDLPCGHGRVLRFLKARFPDASITACDLDPDGIAFCADSFGALAAQSSTELEQLELPGPFDLIWCGSLVTHLDEHRNAALLALFERELSPDGVALMTTHGELVAARLRTGDSYQLEPDDAAAALAAYDATGFGYADYPWSPGYGVSISSRDWIDAAATRAGLNVTRYEERGWDDHQDVVALRRRPAPRAS